MEREVELRGGVLSASLSEVCSCFEVSGKRRNCERKGFQFWTSIGLEGARVSEATSAEKEK